MNGSFFREDYLSISLRKSTALKTKLRGHLNKRPASLGDFDTEAKKISTHYDFLSTITEFPESVYYNDSGRSGNFIELLLYKNISIFLETNLPKLIWRVRLRKAESEPTSCSLFCDFLFDATAIPHKSNLICITTYSESARDFINEIRLAFKKSAYSDGAAHAEKIAGYFKKSLSTNSENLLSNKEQAHLATFEQFFHELELRHKATYLAKNFGSLTFAQRKMKASGGSDNEDDAVPETYSSQEITPNIKNWMRDKNTPFGGSDIDKDDIKLAWLIDEQGEFKCMFETSTMSTRQGHISLANHRPARVAGEIILLNTAVKGKDLLINTRSAAFSSNYFYEELKNDRLELSRLEHILTQVVKILPRYYILEKKEDRIVFIKADTMTTPKYTNSVFLIETQSKSTVTSTEATS